TSGLGSDTAVTSRQDSEFKRLNHLDDANAFECLAHLVLLPPCTGLQAAPHLRHDLLGEDLQLVEGETVRHPRPMHRGDDVVDPEPAIESDHLLGDFGW